jgi:putative membrane protein
MAFLVSYVVYHAQHGSTPFPAHGWVRPAYFTLLVTHVVLAIAVVPLACLTLYRAWRNDFLRHRRLAKLTLPIWMYVSVTGVLVYWMLYHLYGAALS